MTSGTCQTFQLGNYKKILFHILFVLTLKIQTAECILNILLSYPKSESRKEDNLNTCLIPNAPDSSQTDYGCRVYKVISANTSQLFMAQQPQKVSSSSPLVDSYNNSATTYVNTGRRPVFGTQQWLNDSLCSHFCHQS